jgi:hypothetical protein
VTSRSAQNKKSQFGRINIKERFSSSHIIDIIKAIRKKSEE